MHHMKKPSDFLPFGASQRILIKGQRKQMCLCTDKIKQKPRDTWRQQLSRETTGCENYSNTTERA